MGEGQELYSYILPFYQLYADGVSVRELKEYAETLRAGELKEVI